MAGMFYSLQEIADKIGAGIQEAEELVKLHKLREFRDGQRVVFKVTDVDSVVVEVAPQDDAEEISLLEPEAEAVEEEIQVDDTVEASTDDDTLELIPEEDAAAVPAEDDTMELVSESDTLGLASETNILAGDDDTLGLASETNELGASGADSVAELLSGESEFDLGPLDTNAEAVSDESINALLADDVLGGKAEPSLDDDQSGSGADLISDLTSADTHGATTGINVLSESDADYPLSSDSKSDTQDADFEDEFGDLDADINLDTVGSGSGLLDLSLQADDTSLGAVLDEILPEAEEGDGAMPSAEDFGMGDDGDGVFEETPANGGIPVGGGMPSAVGARYIEIPPDALSNACGISLLLPIVAIVFALIVVLTFSMSGYAPSFMGSIEGSLMYIVIGLSVVSLLVVGIGAMVGGGSGEPKAKKAKKVKAKKHKKPKKAKKNKKK